MVFRITPSLGPDIEQVGPYYWDLNNPAGVSYQLGSRVNGSDGYEYVLVKAGSSDIAAATQVSLDADFVASAGSGGFYTTGAVPADAYFHARKGNAL